MSGTHAGGVKAAKRNLEKNPDFFKEIGRIGGRNGRTGGFYKREECNCEVLDGPHTKPMCQGKIGGTISRRNKGVKSNEIQ